MADKATYEELKQRVKELEKENVKCKQVEDELRQSNNRYKILFDNSVAAMFRTSIEDGKVLSVNDACVQMLGFSSKQELISKYNASGAYVNPDDRKRLLNELNSKGQIENLEAELYRKDGTNFWGAFYAKIYPKEGYIEGTAMDITSRKQAEAALRESEKNLKLIYDTAGDVIFQIGIDPDDCYRFLSINQAFLDATGLTEKQVVGKRIEEIIPEPSHSLVLGKYKEAIREKKIVKWKETSIYPSGVKIGDVRITPAFDENGACTHLIGTVHDITEIKQAEEALQKINEQLEQKVEQRTTELINANEQLKREIEARKRWEDELKGRIKYEKMLNDISAEAVFVEDIDKFQKRCLNIMGKALDVSRIYIFEHRQETDTMDNTFEWVAPGIWPLKENRQGISSNNVPWWMDMMKNKQIINYKDIEDIPSEPEKEILRAQNIMAILVVPRFIGGNCCGFMGFDECRFHREWKKEDINILDTSAQIITRAINRYRSETELRIKDNAVESSMNAMVFADTQGNLAYANKSFLKTWGYDDNKEVIGRSAVEFWQDSKKSSDIMKVLKKTGRWFGELVARRKDGSLFNVQLSASMVMDSVGKPILMMGSFVDITKQKRAEKALWKRETALVEKSRHLEEANTALRIILKQLSIEKKQIEKRIISNVKQLILPYLSRLKNSQLKAIHLSYVNNIENHLNEILSPFVEKLSSEYLNLTSSEIRVAWLIKEGKTTKEIAGLLQSSESVIFFHRHNIRKKLGMINKKINLKSHLQTL